MPDSLHAVVAIWIVDLAQPRYGIWIKTRHVHLNVLANCFTIANNVKVSPVLNEKPCCLTQPCLDCHVESCLTPLLVFDIHLRKKITTVPI